MGATLRTMLGRRAEVRQVRGMAIICFAAAAVATWTTLFPVREEIDYARRAFNVGLALVAGVAYWRLARFFRAWMLYVVVTLGFLWGLIGLAQVENELQAAITLATLLWTCVYVAVSFETGVVRAYAALVVVGILVALNISGIGNEFSLGVVYGTTFAVTMEILGHASTLLRSEAKTDPLTGLLNRKGLEREFVVMREMAARREEPLALLHVDLDGFKQVNDEQGHRAGDQLLVDLAEGWRGVSRQTDLLARIGGDEFVVLLPGVDEGAARAAIERLADASPIAWSCGLVHVGPGESLASSLHRADEELYEQKAARRRYS